jgi:integrase/recombinase XerD
VVYELTRADSGPTPAAARHHAWLRGRLVQRVADAGTAQRRLAQVAERARGPVDLDGWTLHRLRRSAFTHDAESGTSPLMLPARSRHASVRFLSRYARPGVGAVARHVAARDPAARRRR